MTADGRGRDRVGAERTPTCSGALRGGGGNFGVVTAFTLRLHPVGPIVLGGMLAVPGGDGRRARALLPRLHASARPTRSAAALAFITAPPEDFVPEPVRGPAGDRRRRAATPARSRTASERLPRPARVRSSGRRHGRPMPYVAVQQLLDPPNPKGMQNYWTADFLAELPDEAVDTLVEHAPPSRCRR